MEIDETSGLWTFKDMTSEYMYMRVYFQAFNGIIWSSVDNPYLLEINLAPIPTCGVTALSLDSLTGPEATLNPTAT